MVGDISAYAACNAGRLGKALGELEGIGIEQEALQNIKRRMGAKVAW